MQRLLKAKSQKMNGIEPELLDARDIRLSIQEKCKRTHIDESD